MDGFVQIACNMDLLPKLNKNAGHASILTDRLQPFGGNVRVFKDPSEHFLCDWPRLICIGRADPRPYILRQLAVCLDAQPRNGVRDV